MSKNLTRKGLALGAVVALGSSLFAGSPAFAAPAVSLQDVNEVGAYKMIEGELFTLKAAGNVDFSSYGQLRVQIKNVNGGDASGYKFNSTSVASSTNQVGTVTSGKTATDVSDTAGSTAVFGLSGSDGGASSIAAPFTFAFTSTAADDAPKSYEVTVFADSDNDAVLDTDEAVKASQTVTFLDVADVETAVTVTAPVEGDTQVTGSIDIVGVDDAQLSAGDFGVYINNAATAAELAKDGSDSGTDLDALFDTVAWNSTDKKFEFATVAWTGSPLATTTQALNVALAADLGLKFQVKYKADGTVVVGSPSLGAAATRTVAKRVTGEITADVVSGKAAETATDTFAEGDATFQIKATVKDTASPAVAIKGAAVTAKVEIANISLSAVAGSEASLTVNGTKHTAASTLPGASGVAQLALTTDANGEVFVTLSTDNFSSASTADTITVTFTVENRTSAKTATAAALAYGAYVTNWDEQAVAVDSSPATLNVEVIDQFGGSLPDGYDVIATFDGTATTSAGAQATTGATSSSSKLATITGGKASLAITDDGVGAGTNVYDLTIAKRNGVGHDSALSSATISNFPVKILTAAQAANTIGLTIGTTAYGDVSTTTDIELSDADGSGSSATTGWALELADFITGYATRNVIGATEPTLNATANLAGTLTIKATSTAAAVNVSGATVTFSGADLQFVASVDQNGDGTDEKIYGVGSVTTVTDSDGAFDVVVSSNKAGKQTVTITSGGVSQKVVISFLAADDNSGTSVSVSAPSVIKAGRTLLVSGVITDKYGNPIQVEEASAANNSGTDADLLVSYDGPGLIVGALPTSTDAAGKYSFRVLLGADDAGVATVTVKYDAVGDLDFADTGDIVKEASTLIGVSASVSAGSKKANVVVKNAEGLSVKVVSGSKVATKVATSDSYKLSLSKLTSGSKTVKVYVNDILVASKKVTVKK